MKKVLLATTAVVLSAGVAAADVSVGGSGRMGVIKSVGTDDWGFTSRIRISFTGSGETDGGLTFGGSIRADNSGGGNAGTAGSVFVSGAFGTITMGDVSGAPEAAVGDVSGVGLTGIGDLNEAFYLSNSDAAMRPAMRYDYTTGAFGIHISADNPSGPSLGDDTALGIAVSYDGGAFTAGLGYETVGNVDHIAAGGSASFGDATIKATYGVLGGDADGTQYAISLDYSFGAASVTAFYHNSDDGDFVALGGHEAYGLGASYDLGGGASLAGGYVRDETADDDGFDFGISFTF